MRLVLQSGAKKPIKMTPPDLRGGLIVLIGLLSTTPTTKAIDERCSNAQPECVIFGRFWFSQEFSIASVIPSQNAGLSAEEFWVRRVTKIIDISV